MEDSKARAARSIAEVRKCLGVRLEDNLQSARLALVAEGEHDVAALSAVLSDISPTLARDLTQGSLVIESLGGGGKLKYRLTQYTGGVCASFVVMDNDQQGRSAVTAALDDNLLSDADYILTAFPGKTESELEDFVDPSAYLPALNDAFALTLSRVEILRGRKKWSARLAALFQARGKVWNPTVERKAKAIVAASVEQGRSGALLDDGSAAVTAVARRLEALLGHEQAPRFDGEGAAEPGPGS